MSLLGSLRIDDIVCPDSQLFLARIAALAILIAGILFDTNVFAPLVLLAAIDPPNLLGFLAGHLLAVAGSGLFATVLLLALQGVLLSVFGERACWIDVHHHHRPTEVCGGTRTRRRAEQSLTRGDDQAATPPHHGTSVPDA